MNNAIKPPTLTLVKTRPVTFLDPAPYELPEREPEAVRRNPTIKGNTLTTANEVASMVQMADKQVRIDSARAMSLFIAASNKNANTLNRALDALDVMSSAVDELRIQLEHVSWSGRKRRALNVLRRWTGQDSVMPPDVGMHLPPIVITVATADGADRDQGRS